MALLPSGRHTVESFQHFTALQTELDTSDAETIRQAFALSLEAKALRTAAAMARTLLSRLYGRTAIDETLRLEIDIAERALWNALFLSRVCSEIDQ